MFVGVDLYFNFIHKIFSYIAAISRLYLIFELLPYYLDVS